MRTLKYPFFLAIATIATSMQAWAQETNAPVEMADKMREDGKIWIVVAVVAVVFIGIAVNMLRLDSKISKIEKELNIK